MFRSSVVLAAFGLVACNHSSVSGGADAGGSTGITGIGTASQASSGGDDGSGSTANESSGTFGNDDGETGACDLNVAITRMTPTVVLLVDQSGSMTSGFSGMDRWDAVYNTLMDPSAGIVQQLESSVRFGLALYSHVYDDDNLPDSDCPLIASVAPAISNFTAIENVYKGEGPLDETPTGAALAQVALDLDAVTEPGAKIIVLATDGEPDTCDQPNPQNGQEEALAAAEMAYDLGISTFIIAVGNQVSENHQQQMANVGTGRARDEDPGAPYYQALDPDSLVDAFDAIIGGFVSCEFTITGEVDPNQACTGRVEIDGQVLECSKDWRLNDPTTLELLGEACDTLQDGEEHVVTANFPCGAVYVP